MTLKWLKVLKLSQICLKIVKVMTPKTDQDSLFLNERISSNLYVFFFFFFFRKVFLIF